MILTNLTNRIQNLLQFKGDKLMNCQQNEKYTRMLEEHIELIKENDQLKQVVKSLKGNIRAIQLRNDELTDKNKELSIEMTINKATNDFDKFILEARKYADTILKH